MDNSLDPSNLSDEQIQQLMDAGVGADKIQALQNRAARKRADASSALGSLKGRYGGGTYVANNPLEFLAAGVKGYQNNKAADQADSDASDLQDSISKARGMYFNTGIMGRNLDPHIQAARDVTSNARDQLSSMPMPTLDDTTGGGPSIMDRIKGAGSSVMQNLQANALRKKKRAMMSNVMDPDGDEQGEGPDTDQDGDMGSGASGSY